VHDFQQTSTICLQSDLFIKIAVIGLVCKTYFFHLFRPRQQLHLKLIHWDRASTSAFHGIDGVRSSIVSRYSAITLRTIHQYVHRRQLHELVHLRKWTLCSNWFRDATEEFSSNTGLGKRIRVRIVENDNILSRETYLKLLVYSNNNHTNGASRITKFQRIWSGGRVVVQCIGKRDGRRVPCKCKLTPEKLSKQTSKCACFWLKFNDFIRYRHSTKRLMCPLGIARRN
jgi:hypothetical protein